MTNSPETGLEIAVIGMSGKFPGAKNLKEFWENLKNGIETISTFSTEELRLCGISEQYLENPNYVKAYGVVTGKAYFDSSFFGYTPREAETMDPLIRLFHECAWEALEDAGYDPISYNDSIGIYAGSSDGFGWQAVKTLRNIKTQNEDTGLHITENPLLLSSHISHKLNLRGPSITLFTACSTGLVAVHAACRALLTGECHMALAGAGAVTAAEKGGYFYQEGMIMSPDGHCRPFDVKARGTVYGDGLGIVVLKRLKHALEERDNIRVIIKASAVNNDGTDKSSFTAPGQRRIADVVRTAMKLSRVTPGDVSYIETHGTATPLGDAIETGALKDAFNTDKKEYCAIGSVKSNIGHLDVAAGIAAFIKTVLALVHRLIPASLHFETPNPTIDLINSPFYINAALSSWEGNSPRRAGVCSFGIGGTNAFVLLEEAPAARDAGAGVSLPARSRDYRLILLSARTDSALEQMTRNLAEYLKMNPQLNLADVAYTLQVGKRTFSRRRMLVCSTGQEAVEALLSLAPGKVHTSVLKDRDKKITADTIENLITAVTSTADTPPGEQLKSGLEEIGRAWLNGAAIDWEELYKKDSLYANPKPYRVPLPTYPFERQYYWINPGYPGLAPGKGSPIWLLVNDEHGLETKIRERLRQNGREVVVVRTSLNSSFTRTRDGEFVIDPSQDTHYDTLFQELEKFEKLSIDNRAAAMGAAAPRENKPAGAVVPGQVNTPEEGLYQRPLLSTEYAAPRDEIEKALTRVWQKFFGIREVGIHDDFFELGGDSLKAITVVTDIHKEMNARIPISELFQSTTIDKLAQYIKSEKSGKSATDRYSAIEPVEKKEYYPMSSVQERIYILNQLETNSTGYNTPQIFDLEGQVNRERLEQVFGMLVSRHESLRTCFQLVKGETVQRIDHNPGFKVAYYELAAPGENPGTGREREIIQEFIKPFDLSRSPLLRVGLIKLPHTPTALRAHPRRGTYNSQEEKEDKYLLMTDMHHIVSDGSSIGILFREFIALYSGQTLPVPRIQYKDYSRWQNSAKQQETMKQQETYWVKQFAGNIPVLNLPADYTRPPVQSFAGNTIIFRIRHEETEALKHIALNQDATLFMILLSLYNVLLAKICSQEDIVVGTPIAGRTHADLQPIFGMLVNTLALRNYPSGDKTFKEFLQEVKQNTLSAFENQDYLFEDLVENITLDVHRDVSRNPIFDTMFSLMNFQSQYEANLKIDIPGLSLAVREQERGIAIFDLSLHAIEAEQGLLFNLEFCTKLFKHETIHRFIGYFKRIISAAAAAPDRKICHIEIIAEEEKQQILSDFNGPVLADSLEKSVLELFDQQVETQPDCTALLYAKQHLTYNQLNRRANHLATLLRLKGVGPDVLVGVLAERSLEMIISLLAIVKAGGACLPIDPQYPEARKKFILQNSGINLLLTNVEKNNRDFIPGGIHIIPLMDETIFSITAPPPSFSQAINTGSDLLYLLYTSGSTGTPKGVMLEHRTLLNLIQYQFQYTNIDFSRVLQFATLCFDVSFQEIFSTLLWGGVLILISNQTRKHIPGLFRVIEENQIKTLFLPASFLKFIFNEAEYGGLFPGCVHHIVTAGEQIVVTDKFRGYLKANHVYLHNHYGPTETHIAAALAMEPQSEIPVLPSIGKPLSNTWCYILDKAFMLLPIGVAGELFIGGIQVGRGYLNRPELTAERFHINMSYRSYTSNIYQTGDLARWLPDGKIEFLGRIDTQVKIRGFRVELGEIESLLLSHRAIEDAVVIDRKDFPGLGDQYLCAYIAASAGIENLPNSTELKEYLARKLPDYMVPSFFVPMERIPLTLNGKVDRKALPKPAIDAAENYTAPGNREEESLVEIWSEVLGLEKKIIGIDSDFFQLGGHSLKATVLTTRIHKTFEVEIILGEMFRHPTIRELAQYIKAAQKKEYFSIPPVEKKEYYPLSSAQQRMYILQHIDPGSTVYNMPQAVQLEGDIDIHQLEQTFRRLVQRHEVYRTSFVTVNEEPVQRIEGIDAEGTRGLAPLPDKPVTALISSFIRPFDLSKAPLLRVGLIKLLPTPAALRSHPSCTLPTPSALRSHPSQEGRSILLVDMHHIVSDGTSVRVLIREFMRLFQEEALANLRIQYKDYAYWQNSRTVKERIKLQQDYWLKEFPGEIPVLNLPYDGPRPTVQSFAGSTSSFDIGEADTAALNQLALEQGATLFMVLAALFNILLSKLSGQEDIIIGTPIAGRHHADLEKLIGMFVNTLALRNYPNADKTFEKFLQEIKIRTLDAFANQEYQFENLVEQVAVTRNPGRNPIFDVMLGLQNMLYPVDEPPRQTGQQASDYDFDRGVSRLDLTWNAGEKQGRLVVDMEFSTQLFKKETIERFIRCFKQIITSVTQRHQKGENFSAVRIADIECIPRDEKQLILFEFNNTRAAYPKDKTLHRLFAEQVERTPDNITLVAPSDGADRNYRSYRTHMTYISYRELNDKSNRLTYLLKEKGVGPDTIVAIKMERSLELIIGLLAILKAGGAYLPIDPNYPEERIKYMLEDCGAKILLSAGHHPDFLAASRLPGFPASLPSSLAYIIYTSGSTGRPKGVLVQHQNVVSRMRNSNFIDFTTDDRILPTGNIIFDISVFEIWWPLLNGLALFLANQPIILNAEALEIFLIRNRISILHLTPQLFNQLSARRIEIFAGLKYFLVGGDLVTPHYVNLLRNTYKDIKILHMYGPTENTIFSTFHPVTRNYDTIIPIGKPLGNSFVYIVDKAGNLVPIGVPGELLTGGDGTARGYLNNPELTAEKFGHDLTRIETTSNEKFLRGGPGGAVFSKSAPPGRRRQKIYKSGDLARWLPDGSTEFLGRIDHQVKIRGYRIEPGEIESRLLELEEIKEAVVLAKKNTKKEKYLCAYIVTAKGNGMDMKELRDTLLKVLPDYMVPSYFVPLASIPLTSSGKVNREALPEPQVDSGVVQAVPGDRWELELAELWAEILSIKKNAIGIDADFFQLGGHSLKATVLTARIHKAFNVEISLTEIFRHPTIRELAQYIKAAKKKEYFSIQPVEKKEYYPLSSAQQRMYILQHIDPDNTVYNIPQTIQLEGDIGLYQLEQTFSRLIQRHEVLRTSFVTVNEEPVQRIEGIDAEGTRGLAPLSDKPVTALISSFIRPFDLSKAPLLRVGLIKLLPTPSALRGHPSQEGRSILMVDMHHIISDGTSVRVLIREFMRLFQEEALPNLRIQYKDYAYWQNSRTARERIKLQQDYWLKEFPGEIPVLNLPYDGPRPAVQSFAGNTSAFDIGEADTAALNQLALEQGATLFMVLAALFNILLSKLSGQEDIIIGTPTAGRHHADLEILIGMFVNTLALRNFPNADKTFEKFLQEIKIRTLDAFANQEYQFENLVEQVAVTRNPGRSPLFDVMLGLQNMLYPVDEPRQQTDQQVPDYDFDRGVSRLDLTWNAGEKQGRLVVDMEFSTQLFKKETIERFIRCFKQIVTFVTHRHQKGVNFSAVRIADIESIPREEKQLILFEFNNTRAAYPKDRTLHRLFTEQVERTPDNITLVAPSDRKYRSYRTHMTYISYCELNDKSNRLTYRLKEKGVAPGTIVGIMMERSIELLIGLLGILKAGGVYLPLDPDYPGERIKYMLEDCGARILLKKSEIRNPKLETNPNDPNLKDQNKRIDGTVLDFEHLKFEFVSNFEFRASNLTPSTLAYIIYTSGSTGRPKGVLVQHQNVVSRVKNSNLIDFTTNDRILPTGNIIFDISVFEIWWPLLNGLTIFLANQPIILNAEELGKFLIKNRISILHLTPQLFNQFSAQRIEIFAGLRYFLVGGDLVTPHYVNLLRNTYKDIKILHMYGPTENTIFSTFHPVTRNYDKAIPIGKPLGNSFVYIVDKAGNLVPIGVSGELLTGGDGTARGYLNNPGLTAERFCLRRPGGALFEKTAPPGPPRKNFSLLLSPHSPIYKTGDLARWLADGNIEFLGRIDHQVKIRGFRVEIGEIENQLLKHPGIKEAVVQARAAESGEKYLSAYIVSHRDKKIPEPQLREYLSKELPEYMIPAYFVWLDEFPLTPNRKIDRRRLPEPQLKTGEKYLAPTNEIEKQLVEIWSGVLARDALHGSQLQKTIGIEDNFFEMGGHSLKATFLAARIHKELQVKIPLAEIFKNPTIRGLSGYIRDAAPEKYAAIRAVEKKEYYILSSPQKRLYILQQMDLESIGYNIPGFILLAETPDMEKLEKTFIQLIKRHESLRTSFHLVEENPVQRIHDEVEFPRLEGTGGLAPLSLESAAHPLEPAADIISSFIRPFDLSHAPLLRVGLIELPFPSPALRGHPRRDTHNSQEGIMSKYLLMVDMHHTISDGISQKILKQEFMTLYRDENLSPLRLQYKDFAAWQTGESQEKAVKQQETFWLNLLTGEIPLVNLPVDYPRPLVQSFAGDTVNFEISAEHTRALKTLAVASDVTLYMLLLTIFNILLSKITGQEDIIIGTPVASRRHTDLEQIIGMFVNTLVLRNFPNGAKSFNQFLQEVKLRSLQAFENQEYPFELLVEKLDIKRDTSRNPLFDVMFTLQDFIEKKEKIYEKINTAQDSLPIDQNQHPDTNRAVQFDLILVGTESDDKLVLSFQYCTKLFKKETILGFVDYFKKIVISLVENPGMKLSRIEMLSEEEKEKLIRDFNETGTSYPRDKVIHQLFIEQVSRTPDNVALVFQDKQVTYKELNRKSSQLAKLLGEKGMKAENLVGILLDRSLEMILGILAVLKSGAAYLPIDPQYPPGRIRYILEDSNISILLSRHQDYLSSPPGYGGEVVLVEGEEVYRGDGKNPDLANIPGDIAYVIYTSGSTGTPRGVMIAHFSVINLICSQQRRFKMTPADRVLQFSPISFDASVEQIFIALLSGAGLVLIDKETMLDIQKFAWFVSRYAITHMYTVPSFLKSLDIHMQQFYTLKQIVSGGENFPLPLAEKWYDKCDLYNEYGPTEATVTCIEFPAEQIESAMVHMPIGKPLDNVNVYVMDRYEKISPHGAVGELYIGGDGLARGYLNNPELTNEKFLPVSASFYRSYKSYRSSIPKRIYKTGDLVRWLPDGNLQFMGRIDHQVKIRGYRIEPGEIENCLLKHPGVSEAVVLIKEFETGDQYLCAYLVSEKEISSTAIREYLSKYLPDYMIPAYYVQIKEIPLNPNGKIDWKALPPVEMKAEGLYKAPGNEIETKLVSIWSEILGVEKGIISIDADFFRLGGHSLKANVLASRIRKEFNTAVPLIEVFKNPYIESLAQYIKTAAETKAPGIELLSDDNLVILRKGDPGAVHLFLVHAGSGEVDGYIDFCGHLTPGITCWGLRADRLDNYTPRYLTIETLAQKYIEKIKQVQAKGPYYIAGWCIGGTIAFETTRQLEQLGEEIRFLGIINSIAPREEAGDMAAGFTIDSELSWLGDVSKVKGIKEKLKGVTDLHHFWPLVIDHLESSHFDVESLKKTIPGNMANAVPNFDRQGIRGLVYYLNMNRSLGNARDHYIPGGNNRTRMIFFGARESETPNRHNWNRYSQKPFTFYEIEGNHFSIFKPPHVSAFAGVFNKTLKF